jgi:hypothetical protein
MPHSGPLSGPWTVRAAFASAVGAWLIVACSRADNASREGSGTLPVANRTSQQFTRVPASYSSLTFENKLTPTRDFNVFTYRN